MYKLTIGKSYCLYRYVGESDWLKLGSFSGFNVLKKFNKMMMDGAIREEELDQAIRFMDSTTHDTAEFGMNGYFTVSYANAVED